MKTQVILALLIVTLITSGFYNHSRAASNLKGANLTPLPLTAYKRVLVIAPHPDDETLGAGGTIQAALQAGAQVRVVLVTNGDGQILAPLALMEDMVPRPKDYIQNGERRQTETINAMHALGLPAKDIIFLGDPDGQINRLWLNDWNSTCPLKAPFTASTHSPYAATYDPQSSYCGRDLLNDLEGIIALYQPDLVLTTHSNDEHPDHMAVSNFTLLAVARQHAAHPDYMPAVLGYLVHYGYYPQPRGWHTGQLLLPPIPLAYNGSEWQRVDLQPGEVAAKGRAIQAYGTQMRLLRSFLPSFDRPDEIFANLDFVDVSPVAISDLPNREEGVRANPDLPQPTQESTRRLVLSSADLVGLKVTRLGDHVWLTAQTRGPLFPGLRYRIRVKLPDGRTEVATWPAIPSVALMRGMPEVPALEATRSGPSAYTLVLNLSDWGNPATLGFSAEVQQGMTLDRTGWRFVVLRDAGQ